MSNSHSSNTSNLDDILADLEKRFGSSSDSSTGNSSHQTTTARAPKKKNKPFFAQPLIGLGVFALLLGGTALGMMAGNQTTEQRSQASSGELSQVTTTGYSCDGFTPFGQCGENQKGKVCDNGTCQANYRKWVCGNKQWLPDYTTPCAKPHDCPWPVSPGQQCCPVGVDACDLSQRKTYQCIEDPFLNECVSYHPACGNTGVKKAICWWPNTPEGKQACLDAQATQSDECRGGTEPSPSPTPPTVGPTPTPLPFCRANVITRVSSGVAPRNTNGRYLVHRNTVFQVRANISEIIGGPVRRVQFRVMGANKPEITPEVRGVLGKTGPQNYRVNFTAKEYGSANINVRARLTATANNAWTCNGTVGIKVVPPVCRNLVVRPVNKGTRQNPFQTGDQVTLACANASGAMRYEFRIIQPNGTIATLQPLTAQSRISEPYIVPDLATNRVNRFLAQCRVCDALQPEPCSGVWSTDFVEACDTPGDCTL